METFLIITAIVIGIIVLLNVLKSKPKENPKSLMDKIASTEYYQKNKELFDLQKEFMGAQGTDEDVMPDGYGEYGIEVTNPIPTSTVYGSIAYLGKLRTMDGTKVEYKRIGSTSAPNINQIIDEYEIFARGQKITNLFICPYNKKNSDRAPKGFKISPLP